MIPSQAVSLMHFDRIHSAISSSAKRGVMTNVAWTGQYQFGLRPENARAAPCSANGRQNGSGTCSVCPLGTTGRPTVSVPPEGRWIASSRHALTASGTSNIVLFVCADFFVVNFVVSSVAAFVASFVAGGPDKARDKTYDKVRLRPGAALSYVGPCDGVLNCPDSVRVPLRRLFRASWGKIFTELERLLLTPFSAISN